MELSELTMLHFAASLILYIRIQYEFGTMLTKFALCEKIEIKTQEGI